MAKSDPKEFQRRKEYAATVDKYDSLAFYSLSSALIPIILIYCGYSLVFERHMGNKSKTKQTNTTNSSHPLTGWLSWFLSSLAALVYALGFVRMTPQLFINYKLKSVVRLPWRAFVYKAISTFIDDLFAFIIKMV